VDQQPQQPTSKDPLDAGFRQRRDL
jgi:hypothetical protein